MASEMDKQLQESRAADAAAIRAISDHIVTHEDPYPFVLEVLRHVFLSGMEAHNIGGSEPTQLELMYRAAARELADGDWASMGVFAPDSVGVK